MKGKRDPHGSFVGVVAACTALAGCGVDPARDCVEEFEQEYKQESGSLRLLDLCPGQDLHLPAFGPQRTDVLRIEYSGGDYFTVLVHREWTVETRSHEGRPCSWVTSHEIVRRHLSRDGQTQSTTTYNGTLLDADGARAHRLMQFGMVPRAAPDRGRFRDYLKTALIHLVTDYHRSRQAWPQGLLAEPADARATPNLDADNTFVQNDIGIQVQMTDVLALAAAYSIRYNTDPPLGFGKTDSLTTLNLVYEIK